MSWPLSQLESSMDKVGRIMRFKIYTRFSARCKWSK